MNKIVFVGAVELSKVALDELLVNNITPSLVVTLEKRLAHRHSDYVDLTYNIHNIPVLEVTNINKPSFVNQIKAVEPDYILVWGWSQLIKPELISISRYGCIGLHPSPLPRNRGRAVIPWTILTGQSYTGVTMFYIDEGMDSGDIIQQNLFTLQPRETASTLYRKTEEEIRKMVDIIAPTLKEGRLDGFPQDQSKATYFAKRTPEDGRIDWTQPAHDIDRLIRATTKPYPGAFTYYEGKKITIWDSDIARTNWIGIPGQILCKKDSVSIIVQTSFEQLEIGGISIDGGIMVPAASYFTRMHGKFR